MSDWKAPFMTPQAVADLERLWCHTETPQTQIRAMLLATHGVDISPEEHAHRRGLLRLHAKNQASRTERYQMASLAREQAPGRRQDNPVRKSSTRYPAPPGGFRIGQ
jgi:thioesterase domain-containing protein